MLNPFLFDTIPFVIWNQCVLPCNRTGYPDEKGPLKDRKPPNDRKPPGNCRKAQKNAGLHRKTPRDFHLIIKQRILSWEYAGIAHIYDFRHLKESNRSHSDINSLT